MKYLSKFLFAAGLALLSCTNNDEPVVITSAGSSYFPLDIGNRWEYAPIRKDMLLKSAVFTIVSKEVVGDYEYFAMEKLYESENGNTSRDTVLYRVDSEDFVFELSQQSKTEQNRFRLRATEGYTWSMESFSKDPYIVTTSITDVTLNGQVISECKSFSFDVPQWADEEHYFVLARGVGIVEFGNAWGFDYKLKSAHIAEASL